MLPASFLIPIVAVEVTRTQTEAEYGRRECKENFSRGGGGINPLRKGEEEITKICVV
jgi:hypothetical protein